MLTYTLRRLLWMVPTLLGITILIFCVIRLTPGDPAALMVSDVSTGGVGDASGVEAAMEKFRERWGLDRPLHEQYLVWLWNFLRLDFGDEMMRPGVSITSVLWQRLGVTIPLTLVSVLLSYLLALPLGILSAVKQGTLVDKVSTGFLFILYSLPTFWAGLMLILVFGASGFDWLPIMGLHDKDAAQMPTGEYLWDMFLHALLPVATLTYGGLAYLSRQMRVGMLEIVRQDFIRTARAKGLPEKVVVFKHALRNSLIPVITVFAQILPVLIGGSVIVESVFSIPGMGLYAYEGLLKRDYNVVMATTTFSALLTMAGFLLSDILYALVDPRISYD